MYLSCHSRLTSVAVGVYNRGMRRHVCSLALMTAFWLSSCTSTVYEPDWSLVPGGSNYVLEYNRGVPRQKKLVLRESEQAALREYMQEMVTEGNVSLVSYAPSLVLSGECYSLNFTDRYVVLNIWQEEGGSGDGCQYVRPCSEKDEEMLKLIRRRTSARALPR